jgi:predicted glycosyltransferase
MRILVAIGHPAQVHLFKNFIWEMQKKGHKVFVTAKDDKSMTDLLKAYNIKFINLGKKGTGLKGKIFKQIIFDLKILRCLYKYNIDVAMGTAMSVTHACLLHKSKSYIFN